VVHLKKKNDNNKVQVVSEVPYTEDTKYSLPMLLTQSVDSIISHSGFTFAQDVQVWQMDQEDIPVSKYADNLPLVDNGVAISPDLPLGSASPVP
jgi:hypothetical protein